MRRELLYFGQTQWQPENTALLQGAEGYGSLLEKSMGGKQQIQLQGGNTRTFLQDGDTVIMRGGCGEGERRVGFGSCTGTVLAACTS